MFRNRGGFAALILAQKNLSIAAVTGFVTFIMVFVAGARKRFMFGVITPIILFAGSFFLLYLRIIEGEDF